MLDPERGIVLDPAFYGKAKAIDARVETEARLIDRAAKTVTCEHLPSGETYTLPYDRLVIATGATPICPPVPGVELAEMRRSGRRGAIAPAPRRACRPAPRATACGSLSYGRARADSTTADRS